MAKNRFLFSTYVIVMQMAVVFLYPSLGYAETLRDAVAAALNHHPSVKAAKARLQGTGETENEEFSGFFPTLQASATAGRIFQDNATSRGLSVTRGDAYSYFGEGSVSLRQPLLGLWETSERLEAARARLQSARGSFVDERETIALQAVQAFVDVLRTYEAVGLLYTHKEKLNEYKGRIETLVEEGASDEAILQQAREILAILDGIIVTFEGQMATAEANFAEVIGREPSTEIEKPVAILDRIPANVADAKALTLTENATLTAARLSAEAVKHDIAIEQYGFYPDVDGELSYLESDKDDVIGGEIKDARAVVKVNWNFETGGAQNARVMRTKFEYNQALAEVEEIENQLQKDVELAYAEYETASRQLKILQDRLEVNEKLVETQKVQFEGSRIDILQLMQSENQLLSLQLEALNAEYRVLLASYVILGSMGILQDVLDLEAKMPAIRSSFAKGILRELR